MTTVFTQTTIITADTGRTVLHERALAVDGDVIAAIGPTEELLRAYPRLRCMTVVARPSCPA
jgi:hypothetical protein